MYSLFNRFFRNKNSNFIGDSDNKNLFFVIAISLVVIAGAAIRIYNIDFGLPLNFHPDEVPKVSAIERMHAKFVQGLPNPFDPEYFLHPSLLLYSTYLMGTIFMFLHFAGDFRELTCLGGRLVSFFAGVL